MMSPAVATAAANRREEEEDGNDVIRTPSRAWRIQTAHLSCRPPRTWHDPFHPKLLTWVSVSTLYRVMYVSKNLFIGDVQKQWFSLQWLPSWFPAPGLRSHAQTASRPMIWATICTAHLLWAALSLWPRDLRVWWGLDHSESPLKMVRQRNV